MNSNFDPYEVINRTNEIERAQMIKEKNDCYNIPEHLNKISIMDVIDTSSLRESDIQSSSRFNDDCGERGEPMTFKPKNIKTVSDEENNETYYKTSNSHIKTNECLVIVKSFKDNMGELYDKVCCYYDNVKRNEISFDGSNYAYEIVTFANEIIENVNLWKEDMERYYERAERGLSEIKERNYEKKEKDAKLKEMENSILQVTKALNNQSSPIKSNSFMKYKELNTNSNMNMSSSRNSEYLLNKLNEIEEVEKVYNEKITNYENEITKLNEHIKYYQNIVAQSKNLIDDLYDKNKIITAKLIKYKQICESNNITVGNSNASTFY